MDTTVQPLPMTTSDDNTKNILIIVLLIILVLSLLGINVFIFIGNGVQYFIDIVSPFFLKVSPI